MTNERSSAHSHKSDELLCTDLSNEARILPSVEYGGGPTTPKTMPHEIWETLSDHAKHLCRWVKCEPGVWPPGAGVNHPLADARFDAFVRMGGWGNRDPALMEKAKAAYRLNPTVSSPIAEPHCLAVVHASLCNPCASLFE